MKLCTNYGFSIRMITLILIFFLVYPLAWAQDTHLFERMTIEDGLSNNSINCILQTQDGFLWIATKDGLNRYDGQGFKVFKYDSADSISLPENYVMSLVESSNGVLWIGTWGGGLCKYDQIIEKFIPFRLADSKDDYIQCLFEDHDENIWFGTTEGGLFKLTPETGKIDNYFNSQGLNNKFPANNVTCITEDSSNQLWIGTWDAGLIHFNPVNGYYRQYLHDPQNINTIANNGVWHISNDANNCLILSTFTGIDRFNIHNGEIIHNPDIDDNYKGLLSTTIRQTITDKRGRIWIGSYDYYGLFLIDQDETGLIKNHRFINEDDNPHSISIDRIRWIYEDMKGNIWIGTENGLNKLPVHQPFRQFRHLPRRPNSLGGRVVSSICQQRENILWVGYGGGGFDKINLGENQIKHFKYDPAKINSLSDNDVTSIYKSTDGYLWICTMNGGLNRFDPVSGNFKTYFFNPDDPETIRSNWVLQVLETRDNLFLIGTNSGLDILDRETETFYPFVPEVKDGQKTLPGNISVNALLEDSHKNLWIGTWLDGVYCYNPSEKLLTQYIHHEDDPYSIGCNKITSIYEDSSGIWFGTHSGGLNKFDINTGEFQQYNTQNGLPNDVVFGILSDSKSNLWVSTMKGLTKFNPTTGTIRVYDHLDGLVHNQFNWRASFKDQDGRLYFGGINGFVSFHPDSIKVDTVPPMVAITSFKVFNRETALQQSIPATREIVLEHDQNFFSIEFTALDMAPNQKHKYAYMLEGIDPDWIYSGTRTVAFYTDIHHGSFHFLTKACNADDTWSEPVSLSISILPAWWNTWWMKLLGFLSIFGIGIIVTRIRFWHLLEIERIRLTIASDLHDEMGSNLSSISVDSQQLMNNKKGDRKGYELASDIYKTTNETIDSIRDIIWFINPKNDGGENMLFKMKEKAATLLPGLKWSFQVSDDLRFDSIKLEVRRNIFLIYKETLTNVVRHSSATKCSIKILRQTNLLQMSICDNGKGFNLSDKNKHGGLANIYHRAKKIHAHIELNSEKGSGTCLILELPLKTKSIR